MDQSRENVCNGTKSSILESRDRIRVDDAERARVRRLVTFLGVDLRAVRGPGRGALLCRQRAEIARALERSGWYFVEIDRFLGKAGRHRHRRDGPLADQVEKAVRTGVARCGKYFIVKEPRQGVA